MTVCQTVLYKELQHKQLRTKGVQTVKASFNKRKKNIFKITFATPSIVSVIIYIY